MGPNFGDWKLARSISAVFHVQVKIDCEHIGRFSVRRSIEYRAKTLRNSMEERFSRRVGQRFAFTVRRLFGFATGARRHRATSTSDG